MVSFPIAYLIVLFVAVPFWRPINAVFRDPPPDWNGARWRRRSLAEIRQRRFALDHRSLRGITVDSEGVAVVGDHPWTPILLRVP